MQPHQQPLVFLDSAASSQKPVQVLEAMDRVYRTTYANVHRGIYQFSEQSTSLYDQARLRIARFIGAPSPDTLVFTRNATEALNMVAYAYGRHVLEAGDEIVLTELEHHSNMVPWLVLARERGAHVKVIPLAEDGTLDLGQLESIVTERAKLVCFAHVSNVLGTITDPAPIINRAHAVGAAVVIDACQSVPHMPLDVTALDCDFLAFSGHKMLGPTGIGVLYARRPLLETMPPFLTGGGMISAVDFADITWNDIPLKFEAGTPAFVEAIGLAAAVDYLDTLGMEQVREHERELLAYALEQLAAVEGITIVGPSDPDIHGGVVSFMLDGIHPHDTATILDRHGIAVRAGNHCAQPLHHSLGLPATVRASFYIYNDRNDVDALIEGINDVRRILRR